jgi:DNA-binding transcriptional MerR regulator
MHFGKQGEESMPGDDKLFYTIGEVAKLANVKPYVLRYWETEFDRLRPKKTPTGQRAYRKHDVEIALTIKRLVHEEQYTIAGARKKLEELEKDERLDQLDMFAHTEAGTKIPAVEDAKAPSIAWDEVKKWLSAVKDILKKYD